jgi:SAM-dependent methyltransferase
VEKSLADRLRAASTREERAAVYETMYDELFAEVPDHPRLAGGKPPSEVDAVNDAKMRLISRFLRPDMRVVDVGSGDCTFAFRLCRRVRDVVGLDISDASTTRSRAPDNFSLVVYDGFHLPETFGTVDLAFSDQLVEHLHPDDAEWHFRMIGDVLSPGGVYLFRTPHHHSGPHDVSRFFTSGEPEGFHLKEWTFGEIGPVLERAGYTRVSVFWSARGRCVPLPLGLVASLERVVGSWPRAARVPAARVLFPSVVVAAHKGAG